MQSPASALLSVPGMRTEVQTVANLCLKQAAIATATVVEFPTGAQTCPREGRRHDHDDGAVSIFRAKHVWIDLQGLL